MNYANLENIKELLRSNISSYRISKDTGVSETSLNNYRKEKAVIENITLGTAIKLQRFYGHSTEKGGIDGMTREEAFGRALGVLAVMSERLFEKGKPAIDIKYMGDLGNKPMSTYTRAHQDITQYTGHFDAKDIELFDRLNDYIGELDESTFTNEPLEPVYIVYSSKEKTLLKQYTEEEK